MKLHLGLLQKMVDLPQVESGELRRVLDDLGLEVKAIDGDVYTIETLANRGDHLHVLGMAREFSARYLSPLRHPPVSAEISDRKASIPVKNATVKCMRYSLLEMTLPKRMSLRSDIAQYINADGESDKPAIVDLLNYIQLEIGQPMHAFDKEKIEGEIRVELSEKPEEIEGLDGKKYKVPVGSIMIRDKVKTVAVGGVIGCANSMVSHATERVLIESASFDPICVRKTARGMGISTDASQLFEKGCDTETVLAGLKRLINLASAGGAKDQGSAHVVGLTLVEGTAPAKTQILLDTGLVRKHMNLPRLDQVEITARLKNLGFQIHATSDEKVVKVDVPTWRVWDVATPEDLVEEFARAHGYSRVKQELPPLDYEMPEPNNMERLLEIVEPSLVGHGFHEVICKGFYSAADVQLLSALSPDAAKQHLAVINSVESNYSHMKITNLIHLARLAEVNHRRGVLSVKVYELGRLFASTRSEDGPYEYERDVLTIAASGRWQENEWRKGESRDEQAFYFKGVVEAVVSSLGQKMSVAESKEPFLHPGYQAAVKIGRSKCGFFGLIHPQLQQKLDLKNDLFYAELDAEAMSNAIKQGAYEEGSEFPSIRRDVTLKVSPDVFASRVADHILETKAENLSAVTIVDNFKKAEEAFRRVTFRITFQNNERTLEAAEVDRVMENILSVLREKHSVELV